MVDKANAASGSRRAVFLDRDGVINWSDVREGKPYAPRDLESFRLFPDVPEALHALHNAGFLLVVVTNQPDVAKGWTEMSTVEAIHDLLLRTLPIDAIKACFHLQGEGCSCRKPEPGMLMEASRELNIDLARSFMVGDRWSDVAAGLASSCYTIFIDRKYAEPLQHEPHAVVTSLAEATEVILSMEKNGKAKGSR